MKTIHLIGIGAGNPEHLTLEAVRVMNSVDVFFLLEKEGQGKEALLNVRRNVIDRYARDHAHRVVQCVAPKRDRAAATYEASVRDWRDRRTDLIGDMIEGEMTDSEVGAFLVWGDPDLYDGMIDSLWDLKARRVEIGFDFTVVPGITSIQALTARHRIALNRIGENITITTGRQLEDVDPKTVTNTVVMLDAKRTYRNFMDTGHDIFWGAYLGTPEETLIAGPVAEVADQIDRALDNGRSRNSWIMDTYLLRKR